MAPLCVRRLMIWLPLFGLLGLCPEAEAVDPGSAEPDSAVSDSAKTSSLKLRQEAVDQYGNSHRWSAQEGAVTIVDFAASWCLPCRQTLPRLQAFAIEHPEVRVLVISVDEAVKGRDALVEDLGLSMPVLWDQGHQAAEHYRPKGMPATFVFDAAGQQILSVVGSKEKDWQQLLATVKEEVGEKSGPSPVR